MRIRISINKTNRLNFHFIKISGLILLIILSISCITIEKTGILKDDELFVVRKYVGNFIGYRYTGPADYGWPNTVLIKTTQDSVYGKISAYCSICQFTPGEKLYIRRVYQSPGAYSYWTYHIENDKENMVSYKLSEFQEGNRALSASFR